MALTIIISLLYCRLANSYCYPAPSPKNIMYEQNVNGIDCITGRFNPPTVLPVNYKGLADEKYGMFDFNTFRKLYWCLLGLISLNIILLFWKRKLLAAITFTLAFIMAMICLIYFDGYHNYYFESAAEAMREKYNSVTIDINFHWLNNPFFWLIFVITLAINWIPVLRNIFKNLKRKRRSAISILDN